MFLDAVRHVTVTRDINIALPEEAIMRSTHPPRCPSQLLPPVPGSMCRVTWKGSCKGFGAPRKGSEHPRVLGDKIMEQPASVLPPSRAALVVYTASRVEEDDAQALALEQPGVYAIVTFSVKLPPPAPTAASQTVPCPLFSLDLMRLAPSRTQGRGQSSESPIRRVLRRELGRAKIDCVQLTSLVPAPSSLRGDVPSVLPHHRHSIVTMPVNASLRSHSG